MLEEALQKLDAGERDPATVLGPIVPIAEGDLPVLDSFQTTVGDGDAEDVAAQVVEDFVAAPSVLAVHDPGRRPHAGWHLVKETGAIEGGADLRPEDLRQRTDRHEIVPVLRDDPCGPIGGEPPGGDEQMDVGMVPKVACPVCRTARQPSRPPTYRGSRASVRRAAAALFISRPYMSF